VLGVGDAAARRGACMESHVEEVDTVAVLETRGRLLPFTFGVAAAVPCAVLARDEGRETLT